MEEALHKEFGGDLRLIVRNVVTRDTDRQGYLYEAKPEEAPKPDPGIERIRDRTRDVLRARMARQPARSLEEVRIDPNGTLLNARAVVSATRPVRPAEVAAIESDLRRFLDPRLRLTVRTVLQSEASAADWVDGPKP